MSGSGPLDRPARRLAESVKEASLALDDVHDDELAECIEDAKDQLESARVELVRREEGSP